MLHSTHIGISRMKSLARQYVWWPKIDCDIEAKVKGCSTCAVSGPDPPPTVLHPWKWPKKPWSRVHFDSTGPFLRKMFLILIDSHSKWIDVHITSTSSTAVTIEKLQLPVWGFQKSLSQTTAHHLQVVSLLILLKLMASNTSRQFRTTQPLTG